MSQLYSRVVKSHGLVNNSRNTPCEALRCTCRRDVEPVDGPGGVTLTLCPDHRRKLMGVGADA